MEKKILIVDDDLKINEFLDFHLKHHGYITSCLTRGSEVLPAVNTIRPSIILLDIRLPDMNGMDVLKAVSEKYPEIHVIMISAHADIKSAVECIKLGAYDFIEKPIALPELDAKVKHVFEQHSLREEVSMLQRELGEKYKYQSLVGKSTAIRKVFDAIEIAMKSDVTVLIEGESGTGKELVARAIHFNGQQKKSPFIAVNCGAIPENLLESELFGHEKGAFTGALSRKIGKFENAKDGSIFLDEIAELTLSLQVKLLRVIQEREIERVGGSEPIPIQARFIVATHRDLKKLVTEEKFREDLYFRVNVFPIHIPPLRERKDDIPELLKYFIKKHHGQKPGLHFDKKALQFLENYSWPGNIRELENLVERLLLINKKGELISQDDLQILEASPAARINPSDQPADPLDRNKAISDTERQVLRNALQEAHGNITRASKLLNMSRDTFYRKMKKFLPASEIPT